MHLFCPSSSARQSEGFVNFLKSQGKTRWTIKQTKNYAIKYGHILDTGDASELLSGARNSRHNVLSALANLAKYQGRYQVFLEIRQRIALSWTSGNNSLQSLQRFFNPDLTLDTMLQQIRQMIQKTPAAMGRIIKFAVLVGLRPAEVVESVRLLNLQKTLTDTPSATPLKHSPQYYNPDRSALEHFRFAQFLRRTKKAYISFVTPSMIEPLCSFGARVPSYNAIRLACRKRGIRCDFRYTRKIYASWLHKEGIPETVIDFLQGRTSPSVFSRHYLTPDSTLKTQVLSSLDRLKQEIEK